MILNRGMETNNTDLIHLGTYRPNYETDTGYPADVRTFTANGYAIVIDVGQFCAADIVDGLTALYAEAGYSNPDEMADDRFQGLTR